MKRKQIKVPFGGKGHVISYKVETIDLSMTPYKFMNVYSVFVDDPELQPIIGDHFTILQNYDMNIMPLYNIDKPADADEKNLKKEIAQQIMNNPGE